MLVIPSSVREPYRGQVAEGDVPSGAIQQQGDVDHWQSRSPGLSVHIPQDSAAGTDVVAGTSKQVSQHATLAWTWHVSCLGCASQPVSTLVLTHGS
jgi:hypothetical protein